MKTSTFIHSSAVVDEGANIGENTKIWHFCHIMSLVEIGENCSFGQNVFVANNVRIGNNVKVQNNVSIYEGVVLEDDVFCGPSMVFTNVRNPRSAFPVQSTKEYANTNVGQGATIGANATIVCGNDLGAWSFIGAGAVVTHSVLDHAFMLGVPARQFGWSCRCGQRLEENKPLICASCQRQYQRTSKGLILL